MAGLNPNSHKLELIEIVKKPTNTQELVSSIIRDFFLSWNPSYFVSGIEIFQADSCSSFIEKWEQEAEFSAERASVNLEELLSDKVRDIWSVAERLEKDRLEQEQLSDKSKKHYELLSEEEEKKAVVYYYVDQRPEIKKADYYIFTPDWITIMRVPQSELGNGVLGVAYLGTNVIKILDSLHGLDFVEVKKHEILHLQYPHMSESWVRQRTIQELGFETKYQ
ncbi:hypothetical protein KY320_02290 [Candidatus Woesearchaeota archaeon]|nr:hypothetical protein [Candidatus Woesearchaeota archaeon]